MMIIVVYADIAIRAVIGGAVLLLEVALSALVQTLIRVGSGSMYCFLAGLWVFFILVCGRLRFPQLVL